MKEAHVSETKKKEVEVLKELMSKYNVVGIIDLTGMPSPQLQRMRKKLENTLIRVTKKRLIKIALENLKDKKKGIEQLEDVMSKNVMPCLILTNEDSFKLAKVLRKAKTNVSAKAGQIAPRDIIIKAGATPFAPGPIIGDFGVLGIKTAVENGKIAVKEEKIIVKEGEEINNKVADMLMKLGIEPMQIGLNLIATYDNGKIFKKDILDVDDQWYLDNIKLIASDGFKLAIQIGYVCKETIEFLIKKAEMESKVLEQPSLKESFKKSLTKKENVDEEKKKEEVKIEEKPKVVEIKEEPEKEEVRVEIIKEPEDKIEILKKEPERKPSAQELVEEVEKEVEKEKEEEKKKKKEEEKKKVPTAAELAARQKEKKKKEPEKVPTAAELAERKKEKSKNNV